MFASCGGGEAKQEGPAAKPESMVKKTPSGPDKGVGLIKSIDLPATIDEALAARQLLMEYSAPMANQSLTEEEARGILEYFRTIK